MRNLIFIPLFIWISINPVYADDTIIIRDMQDAVEFLEDLYVLIDRSNKLNIDDIINERHDLTFKKNQNPSLNYGLTTSGIWIKFSIKNVSSEPLYYILSVRNPDLNIVEFYELVDSRLERQVLTGETSRTATREVDHKDYLFNLNLEPGKNYTFYIKSYNDGDANFIPLKMIRKEHFVESDSREQFFIGIMYGLFIFFIFFHLYYYRVSKDRINLFYTLYIFFTSLLIFEIDGYFCQLTSNWLGEYCSSIKIITPALSAFFLLSFSQIFLDTHKKRRILHKLFRSLQIITILLAAFYFFGYPYLLISVVGLPVLFYLVNIIIIVFSIIYLNKEYVPSKYFLSAFIIMSLALLLYQFRDLGIFSSGFFIDNALRIGLGIEGALLTLALLERFRINQENYQHIIKERSEQVSKQKNALVKINVELEKLSMVASETDNSVAIYDSNGNIEWCNTGFERLYDVTLEELINSGNNNIKDVISHDNIKELVDFCIKHTQPVFFENSLKTKKKKEIWLQTTLTPYVAEQDRLNKLIAIDSDISELKLYERNLTRAKEKAEESDRLKTAFLANTSHEIRTPLNGIIGFSDLLKRDDLTNDKRKRYIDIIQTNGNQLLKLVDDILDISMIESNQLRTNITEFNLNKILTEVFDYFQLFKKNINKDYIKLSIKKAFNDKDDKVMSDPGRLKQVLSNLIDNAVKFTNKGYISFGYTLENSELKFFIEDSGIGISDEQKKKLFVRFAQGEEGLERKYKGAGLGLSISKGIIENLGGKIWYDDSYEKGARFRFTLPYVINKD